MSEAWTPHSKLGSAIAYAYLLRVPILIALILVAFPFIALGVSPAKPIFENFFVLGPLDTLLASLATFLVAWSVVLVALLVMFNAEDRFRVSDTLTQDAVCADQQRVRWCIAGSVVLISAPLLLGQFVQGDWSLPQPWWNGGAVFIGGLVAYLLAYAALFLVTLLSPTVIAPCTAIFPGPRMLRDWLTWAHAHQWLDDSWPRLRKFLLWLPHDITAGYIDNRAFTHRGVPNPARGLPWSGVWLAFSFAVVTVVVYYVIGAITIHYEGATAIPALTFVLLLLLNVNWILGLAAYFWDRFRFPLLALIAVLALVGETITDAGEHFYKLSDGKGLTAIAPYQVLEQRVLDHKPIIIVTTTGGGIQAAAWTVRVLTGLQAQLQTDLQPARLPAGSSFADSVAMISSVSGGAAGALMFLQQYQQAAVASQRSGFVAADPSTQSTNPGACTEPSPLVEKAMQPGLNGVAWALVYRDVPRILTPYFPGTLGLLLPIRIQDGEFLDRGRMLELSWQQTGMARNLSDWQPGLIEGWRPASIFNATIAETGEPFLFSTTDLNPGKANSTSPRFHPGGGMSHDSNASWRSPQPMTFRRMYPHSDIELSTAARLASGFPYVLPVPRALRQASGQATDDNDPTFKYHLIDGGYYDNYGVDTAVQWLDQALEGLQARDHLPPAVLVLQIRAFPDLELPNVNRPVDASAGRAAIEAYQNALPRDHGWLFELYAPILGLMNVRSAGQLLHDKDELLLLRDKWRRPDGAERIRFATFEFPEDTAPLSFKMNPTQERNIETLWCQHLQPADSALHVNLTQVECMFDDSLPACATARSQEPR